MVLRIVVFILGLFLFLVSSVSHYRSLDDVRCFLFESSLPDSLFVGLLVALLYFSVVFLFVLILRFLKR